MRFNFILKSAKKRIAIILFFFFQLGLLTKVTLAGEIEDLNQIKALYDAKQYELTRIKCQKFLQNYPATENSKIVLAIDIKCDYRFKKFDVFNQRLEEFRRANPGHPMLAELDYLKGMAMRQQGKWAESREFFKEYLSKYPDSPYRQYAEEISGASQFALSRAYDAYWNKDYAKAYTLFGDFATSYPTHSRLDEVLFRKAECLYKQEKYDEFLQECDALLQEKPNRKFADHLLECKIATLIRQGKGAEARTVLDYFERNFPDSPVGKRFKHTRLQSYLFDDNIKQTALLLGEWPTVEALFIECFKEAVQFDDKKLAQEELNMMRYFYKVTGQTTNEINCYRNLIESEVVPPNFKFALKVDLVKAIVKTKDYQGAEALCQSYLNDPSLTKDQITQLGSLLSGIYGLQGRMEEAAQIYEKYCINHWKSEN